MIIRPRSLSNLRPSLLNEEQLHKRALRNRRDRSNGNSANAQALTEHNSQSAARLDLELVQRAIANDAAAWTQLYRTGAAKLYRTAFALLRNREDAQDAVQDCWLRAYANLKSFQGRSSFSTWLTRIAINSALMILRKRRNEREASSHDFDEIEKDSLNLQLFDSSPNPEQVYAEEQRKNRLNAAIANLQPRLRTAVQMGYLEERSTTELASALGISLAAVKTRVFHARVALRKSPALNAIVHRKSDLAA